MIVHAAERRLKQALLKIGWPAEDLAGDGTAHPIELDQSGWHLRGLPGGRRRVGPAARALARLPVCGKTLVGAAAMAEAKATTLILVTNTIAGFGSGSGADRPHLAHRGGDRRVLR